MSYEQSLRNFWRDKKVLITGHTGFKGSWLSLWLTELGASVVGYSHASYDKNNLSLASEINKKVISIYGDIRDYSSLQTAIGQYKPEIIIHMAAQSLVRLSYENPIETYATNVLGTVHLLEAAKNSSFVRVVINVTSDKCYENKKWVWGYRENDELGGYDPYSSSKACAELVSSAYQQSYFNRGNQKNDDCLVLASTRAGNVIGGGDWALDRLIPDMIRSFLNKQSAQIRRPQAIRPWQHVLEPLSGYMLLAEKLYGKQAKNYIGAWNFGPVGNGVKTVEWVADYLVTGWGSGANWEYTQEPGPYEAQLLSLDCSKAMNLLGWKPRWTVEEALDHTLQWYKAFQSKADLYEFSCLQINQFMHTKIT